MNPSLLVSNDLLTCERFKDREIAKEVKNEKNNLSFSIINYRISVLSG